MKQCHNIESLKVCTVDPKVPFWMEGDRVWMPKIAFPFMSFWEVIQGEIWCVGHTMHLQQAIVQEGLEK